MSDLKKTPFHGIHVGLGARMVEFGGWEMPVQYTGILDEHQHTRTEASLFDCSHMGQFRLRGSGVGDALDAFLPRKAADQPLGTCRYNFLLNESGGVIDDLIVYRIAEDEYFLVVNAGTREGDAAWILSHLPETITFDDESAATAKLDLQGPKAKELMAKLGFAESDLPPYFQFIETEVLGVPTILSQTGYTGERGFEFYFPADQGDTIWNGLLGLDPCVKPAGLGARDTLRLEVGYPLYGHEMDVATTPIEAGFKRMLDLEDHEFVGKAGLEAPKKKLIGIQFEGRRAAREGAKILDGGGTEIGVVTSGSYGPSVGYAVALGHVSRNTVKRGDTVLVEVGRKQLEGLVAKLPFYKDGTAGK